MRDRQFSEENFFNLYLDVRLCIFAGWDFFLVHTSPEGYLPQDLAVHKVVLCPQGHVNLSMSPEHQEASALPPLLGSLLSLSPCSGRSRFSSLQVTTLHFKGCFKYFRKHYVIGDSLLSHIALSVCLSHFSLLQSQLLTRQT